MKIRKVLTVLLCLLLLMSLGACSAASMSSGGNKAPVDSYYSSVENVNGEIAPELSAPGENIASAVPGNQKLIQKVRLEAETEDMDALLKDVDSRIAALGGYVEAQDIYHGSNYKNHRVRQASLTIRIPASKLGDFLRQIEETSNIVSSNKTTDNVTLSYIATESRIEALKVEQQRLTELLAKAADMKDLLIIEERLTDVRAELEEVSSQLRLYDNLVDYATVYLNIEEVIQYTEPKPEPQTVWERIAVGFSASMKDLGTGLEDLFVVLVVGIPYLIPFVVIGLIVLVWIKAAKKKKAKKDPPAETKQ